MSTSVELTRFRVAPENTATMPGIESFFATIDTLVSAEEGTLAEGE